MTDVVRCCKATYSHRILNDHGIAVHDWIFSDGDPPSKVIIDEWLDLIDATFKKEELTYMEEKDYDKHISSDDDEYDLARTKKKPCIAAHCVAGLGR